MSNVIVWRKTYETFRKEVIAGRLLRVTGRIEREGQVTHLVAERVEDISPMLSTLARPVMIDGDDGRMGKMRCSTGGGVRSSARHPREQVKKLFPSRDFH